MTVEMSSTPEFIRQQHVDVRAAFDEGITRSIAWRKAQLLNFNKMIHENREAIYAAIYKDLGRTKMWALFGDYIPIVSDVTYLIDNLEKLTAKNKRTPDVVFLATHSAYTVKQPLGAVLIMSPWNFPVHLCLRPFAGAIAAGCTAVLKPSELSPHSSQLIYDLVNKYLDRRAFRVVLGAAPEATELLKYKWDKICFTGGGSVGKIVYKAAAEHLTPVLLELGGKSPVIVDESADIPKAARSVLNMKCANAGQICVAPDYLFVHPKVHAHFVSEISKAINEFFGPDPQKSESYGRIINNRHLHRLATLIQRQKQEAPHSSIVAGGIVDEADKYIAPTIVDNVKYGDPLMEDELFGPLLPVIEATTDEAIRFINKGDTPLALYVMSRNQKNIDYIISSTLSGGVGVNELAFHVAQLELPLGGVGASGMGNYGATYSFDAFSHERPVFVTKQTTYHYLLGKVPFSPPFNPKFVNFVDKAVYNAVGVYQPTPSALKVLATVLRLATGTGILVLVGWLFLKFAKAVQWV
ncbi:Aldehyde/histidinol dehydrogenase [Cladochytrium replicatum]|nr:Aldehyde/histidinol dehydrogenase [Cladochytrium replicatum]